MDGGTLWELVAASFSLLVCVWCHNDEDGHIVVVDDDAVDADADADAHLRTPSLRPLRPSRSSLCLHVDDDDDIDDAADDDDDADNDDDDDDDNLLFKIMYFARSDLNFQGLPLHYGTLIMMIMMMMIKNWSLPIKTEKSKRE